LTGEAFTFAEQDDEPMVRAIERVLGSPVERRRVAGFDWRAPECHRRAGNRRDG
jgi:ATP-dependent RNA helicase RhlE